MDIRSLTSLAILLLTTQSAFAVKVADFTRMQGNRNNVLTGVGLVVGLKGTGDGGAYMPAMKPLAAMINKFAGTDCKVDLSNNTNVALVNVIATLPASGVCNGDRLDVKVLSNGVASSLRGGTLYMASLVGPTGEPFTPHDAAGKALPAIPYAIANGPIVLDEPSEPTCGTVRGGAIMEVDLPAKDINSAGQFTLIIDSEVSTWTTASTLAKLINESNDSGESIATAFDAHSVGVQIPAAERARPDSFISNVLRLPFPMIEAMKARPEPVTVPIVARATIVTPQQTQASKPKSAPLVPPTLSRNPVAIGLWWLGGCVLLNGVLRFAGHKKSSTVATH